ncbi:MAG: Crp/Fnr family transcriptional regulator [Bacillaceae bacterium]|nr:Crp/Fnr family transcriptional regulator [Bacillaceae bacterium]
MTEQHHFYPARFLHLFPEECVREWMQHGRKQHFKKGEYIQVPGKQENQVFLMVEGFARIFHLNINGKECVLGVIQEGDFIDLLHVFTDRESRLFARALTDVEVIVLSRGEVKQAVRETPELSMALLHYLSNRLEETIEVLEQVAYEKVEERLLFQLKKLADPSREENGWLPLPPFVTHKDLAGMIASTRETVTFLLNKLTHSGEIRQLDRCIWIRKDSDPM